MSKESYARGFCKAAAAHGVDPNALVELFSGSVEKKASFDWNTVKAKIDDAWKWYNTKATPEQRMLIGGGVGLLGGSAIGALAKHPTTGAIAGTLAGAAAGGKWNEVRKAIEAIGATGNKGMNKAKDNIESIVNKLKSNSKDKKTPSEQATEKAVDSTGVTSGS